jgi:hypothetical protein
VYYNNNGRYAYWNVLTNSGSSGYTDYIPPMTGFFVLVSSGGPSSLSLPVESKTILPSDSRTIHKGASFASEKGLAVQKIKLRLTSKSKTDETIVLLFDDATNSYNEHYDAYKLFSANFSNPYINSVVNGVDYFMKAVADPVSSVTRVPLKLVLREAGTHIIDASEFENMEGIKVVLKHGNVVTNLYQNASYSFTSEAGTFTDFELIIGDDNTSTAVEELVNEKFKAWYSNNFMYIYFPGDIQSDTFSLVIYDFNGRQVLNKNNSGIVGRQTIQLPVILQKGLYVADVVVNNIHYRSKIVVY